MRGSLLYFFHAAASAVSPLPRGTRHAAEGDPLHSPRRITALACYALSQSALPLALRLDRNPPSLQPMNISTTQGQAVRYQLLNLPHYLCAFLREMLPAALHG